MGEPLQDDSRAPGLTETEAERRRQSRRRLVGRRITDLATHNDAWVTPEQIAEYYGVPLKTVKRKWIAGGFLKTHTFPGQLTRVEVKALRAFEQMHQIVPKAS